MNPLSSLLHSFIIFYLASFPISSMLRKNCFISNFAAFPVSRLKGQPFSMPESNEWFHSIFDHLLKSYLVLFLSCYVFYMIQDLLKCLVARHNKFLYKVVICPSLVCCNRITHKAHNLTLVSRVNISSLLWVQICWNSKERFVSSFDTKYAILKIFINVIVCVFKL